MGRHHSRGVHLSVHLSRMALLTTKGCSPTALPAAVLWLLSIPGCSPLPSALGGPYPGLTPLQGPPLGATAPGKREAGAKQTEKKGSKKYATQGCNRRRVGARGTPALYSSALGLVP